MFFWTTRYIPSTLFYFQIFKYKKIHLSRSPLINIDQIPKLKFLGLFLYIKLHCKAIRFFLSNWSKINKNLSILACEKRPEYTPDATTFKCRWLPWHGTYLLTHQVKKKHSLVSNNYTPPHSLISFHPGHGTSYK